MSTGGRTVIFPEGIARHFAGHCRGLEYLLRSMREQLSEDELRVVLEGVVEYALVQLTDIQGAWEAPYLGVLAGATLNLLELHMLAHYLSLDASNAKRMMLSSVIEEMGVIRSLADLKEVGDDIAVLTGGLAQQEEFIRERTSRHGIAYEEMPSFPQLAKLVGCEDQYRALTYLSGKLTHPSAFALFRSPTGDTLDRVVGEILTHATYYAQALEAQVSLLTGVEPPPTDADVEDHKGKFN